MPADAPAATPSVAPFSGALGLEPVGDGGFAAELGSRWSVGTEGKAHGGLLLVLLVRAALARLAQVAPDGAAPEPLAVAADFLRAPATGPVHLDTDVVKRGRTASVVAVRLSQGGSPMLTASVTAGRLPDDAPLWTELPDLPVEPPADAITSPEGRDTPGLGGACELWMDPVTTAFARQETAPPVMRGWARPWDEPTDVLFALLAGDLLPPTVFNLGGRFGWAPTVQLTALLRARPAPGWLRMESRSRQVAGTWFDEDVTVLDAAGRLVCQARQLALAPLPR